MAVVQRESRRRRSNDDYDDETDGYDAYDDEMDDEPSPPPRRGSKPVTKASRGRGKASSKGASRPSGSKKRRGSSAPMSAREAIILDSRRSGASMVRPLKVFSAVSVMGVLLIGGSFAYKTLNHDGPLLAASGSGGAVATAVSTTVSTVAAVAEVADGAGVTTVTIIPGTTGDERMFTAPDGQVYLIHKGDTLADISRTVGISIDSLAKYNDVQDPNLIYTGSTLRFPPGMKPKSLEPTPTSAPSSTVPLSALPTAKPTPSSSEAPPPPPPPPPAPAPAPVVTTVYQPAPPPPPRVVYRPAPPVYHAPPRPVYRAPAPAPKPKPRPAPPPAPPVKVEQYFPKVQQY